MGKTNLNFNSIRLFISKAGFATKKGVRSLSKLVQNRDFQKGATTVLIPFGTLAFFRIRKYKKESFTKDNLYKEILQKHNAIIKELSKETNISKEHQEQLLQYDSKLKSKMKSLETEIEMLKKKIADLEKEKRNEQI